MRLYALLLGTGTVWLACTSISQATTPNFEQCFKSLLPGVTRSNLGNDITSFKTLLYPIALIIPVDLPFAGAGMRRGNIYWP
jgi:hypothetical protein